MSCSRTWLLPLTLLSVAITAFPQGNPTGTISGHVTDPGKLAMPDVKEKGVTLGYRFVGGSPDKLGAFLKSEIAKWAEVAQSASLK